MKDDYINKLIDQVLSKSNELKEHSLNVSFYLKSFGEYLNLPKEEVEKLEIIGLFHDLGKIYISNDILLKPEKLTDLEFKTIQKHPYLGAKLIKKYIDIYPSVLFHHERYDGSGYPFGYHANNIPFYARMTTICDSFDAMTSSRAYNLPLSEDDAIEQLIINKNTQFDPYLVDTFCDAYENKIRKLVYK